MPIVCWQLKPEMERYEWVVIRHPELACAVKNLGEEDAEASEEGPNSERGALRQPEKALGQLSPFLAARHFNLNSRNTSMFMAGNFDSIIVGEWQKASGAHCRRGSANSFSGL